MGIRSLRSTSATEVEFVKRWLLAGALAAIALGGAVAASGQVSPNGDEFQVNTYTTSYQENAAIASDAQRDARTTAARTRFIAFWPAATGRTVRRPGR